jgi:WD40 repeat protein
MFNLSKIRNDIKTNTTLDLSPFRTYDEKAVDREDKTLRGGHNSFLSERVYALVSLPDDGLLASGACDNTIKLWNANSGDYIRTLSGHSSWVYALAVLPNGHLVSGSSDYSIKFWNTASGGCIKTLTGHSSTVRFLAVLPDGRLVSGSDDKTIRLWDTTSGDCVHITPPCSSDIQSLAVLPDGQLAIGYSDNSLKIWNIVNNTYKLLSGHTGAVRALVALPDGRLVSGSDDKTIKLWDTASSACIRTLTGHYSYVNALAVLPDERLVSGDYSGRIKVWDPTRDDKHACRLTHPTPSMVTAFAMLPGNRLASGSWDHSIKFWTLSTMRPLQLRDVEPLLTDLPNSAVQRLNLQNSALDDKDVPALCNALRDNRRLTALDICDTRITREGVRRLYEDLQANRRTGFFRSAPPLKIEHKEMPEIILSAREAARNQRACVNLEVDSMGLGMAFTFAAYSCFTHDLMAMDKIKIAGLLIAFLAIYLIASSIHRKVERFTHCTGRFFDRIATGLEKGFGKNGAALVLVAPKLQTGMAAGAIEVARSLQTGVASGAVEVARSLQTGVAPGAVEVARSLQTGVAPGAIEVARSLQTGVAAGAVSAGAVPVNANASVNAHAEYQVGPRCAIL